MTFRCTDMSMKCEHPDPRLLEGGEQWCRFCGALRRDVPGLMEKLGFSGWMHPQNDTSAPTILNIAREVREEKEKGQKQEGELPIPPPVFGEKDVREVMRVWERQKGIVVYHHVGAWDDPVTWAFVLADIVRNVSRAYVDAGELMREDEDGNEELVTYEHVENRILEGFAAEMEDATEIPTRTEFDA